MNKFVIAIVKELYQYFGTESAIKVDTKISDLYCNIFDEYSWFCILFEIELLYGLDIKEEIATRTDLTILQFSEKLLPLPCITNEMYSEFFEIMMAMKEIQNTMAIEIQNSNGNYVENVENSKRYKCLQKRIDEMLQTN